MHHTGVHIAHSHTQCSYTQRSHFAILLGSWDVFLHLKIVNFFFLLLFHFQQFTHPLWHMEVFNIFCCYFCKFEFWFVKIIEREYIFRTILLQNVKCSAHINHLYWAMYSQRRSIFLWLMGQWWNCSLIADTVLLYNMYNMLLHASNE